MVEEYKGGIIKEDDVIVGEDTSEGVNGSKTEIVDERIKAGNDFMVGIMDKMG